jgi:thiamine kinase-like enzyme
LGLDRFDLRVDTGATPFKGVKAVKMSAVPSVEDVLGRVAMFSDRVLTHRPIPGGLSHHIWIVNCGDRSYVLRVLDPAVSAAGLGLPPATEIANTLRAAESGVGARVFEVLPEVPAIVLEYLPGRTLSAADVQRPGTILHIAEACRRLHAGPRFVNDFSIVEKMAELLELCRRRELRVPDGYVDRLTAVDRIRAALDHSPLPTVPCHNDLLAENFIDSGGVIRIVDYQLAGNNDPTFELGDIAAESDFDPDRVEALTAAYFGDDRSPALTARVRLNLILSNITWTLWFSVHHGLLRAKAESTFDYWAEAADKWGQATRDLDARDFGGLLDTASRRTSSIKPPG